MGRIFSRASEPLGDASVKDGMKVPHPDVSTEATLSPRLQAIRQDRQMLDLLENVEGVRSHLNKAVDAVQDNIKSIGETIDQLDEIDNSPGEIATFIKLLKDVSKSWEDMAPEMTEFAHLANSIFDSHDDLQRNQELSPDELQREVDSCQARFNTLTMMGAGLHRKFQVIKEKGSHAQRGINIAQSSLERIEESLRYDRMKIFGKAGLALVGALLGIGVLVGIGIFVWKGMPTQETTKMMRNAAAAVASSDAVEASSGLVATVKEFGLNIISELNTVNSELSAIRQCQKKLQIMGSMETSVTEMVAVVQATICEAEVCCENLRSRVMERQMAIEAQQQLQLQADEIARLKEENARLRGLGSQGVSPVSDPVVASGNQSAGAAAE